jgi:hypothetical protein
MRSLRLVHAAATFSLAAAIACGGSNGRPTDSPAVGAAPRPASAGRPDSVAAPAPAILTPAQAPAEQADAADQAGLRPVFTAPSSLTQLPQIVRDTLTTRGCTVLQYEGDLTANVVRGAFFGSEDGDWAVLCVVRRDARILVFPRAGGATAELAIVTGAVPDLNARPTPGAILPYGCATAINRVPASALASAVAAGGITGEYTQDSLSAGERRSPAHDGINNGDCEGVSNVYYWTGRRWIQFAGGN